MAKSSLYAPFGTKQREQFVSREVTLVEGRHARQVTIVHPPAGPPLKLRHVPTGREYFQTRQRDAQGRIVYRLKGE